MGSAPELSESAQVQQWSGVAWVVQKGSSRPRVPKQASSEPQLSERAAEQWASGCSEPASPDESRVQ